MSSKSLLKDLVLSKEERDELEALRIEKVELLTQNEGFKELNRILRGRNEDLKDRISELNSKIGYLND